MNDADKAEFGENIAGLYESYGKPLSTAGIKALWLALSDLELTGVKRAVATALREPGRRFAPSPGELRELAGEQTADDRVHGAWALVCAAVRNQGGYKTVDFHDKGINAAIRAVWGGWVSLCDRFAEGESQEPFLRAAFSKAYVAYTRPGRQIPAEDVQPLGGLSEIPREPVLIGSPTSLITTAFSRLADAAGDT